MNPDQIIFDDLVDADFWAVILCCSCECRKFLFGNARENVRKNAPEVFSDRYSLLRSGPYFLRTPNVLVRERS